MSELTVSGRDRRAVAEAEPRGDLAGRGRRLRDRLHLPRRDGLHGAETAERELQAIGLTTSFRQELDGAWTVRFGPLPRDHMRAVLDHFAW